MDNTKPIYIEFSKGAILTDVGSNLAALARTIEISADSGSTEAGDANAIKTLAGYINSPSDVVMRPIVARAFTEAYDRIKTVCQRYLILGRTEDDNRLESIIEGDVVTLFRGTIPSDASGKIPLGSFTPSAGVKYKISLEGIGNSNSTVDVVYSGKTHTLSRDASACDVTGVFDGGTLTVTYKHGDAATTEELAITADSTAYAVIRLDLAMPGNFNIGMTSAIKSAANRIFVDYIMSQVLRFQRPNNAAEALKSVELSEGLLLRALTARNTFARSHHDWM